VTIFSSCEMKQAAVIAVCVIATLAKLDAVNAVETPAARPNIVFVLADDLGWSELGCYGNGFNETPHLDRLALDGMRFTQAYAAAPVCSPYRAALLTGQAPARIGILDYLRPNSANALSTDHVTLPELLQKSGYATGMVGKWHLTGYEFHEAEHEMRPADHGFDWDFAREVKGVGNGANFWPYVFRNQAVRWLDIPEQRLGEDEFLTDRMNIEAVDFIERNQDRPFFLYLSHYAPHSILNGRPDLVEKYRKKHSPGKSTRERCYLCEDHGHSGDSLNHWAGDHNPHLAAMLESIDDGVGMIREKLDELGLSQNTIVIFTSDNGGETNVTSNAPLRGGKSELYEGGIRVPLLVSWSGGNVPAASVCDQPTVNTDFYPTLLDAASLEPDPGQTLDGVSTLAVWKSPAETLKRDSLYWHYPLDEPHFLGGRSAGAIRHGDWKLIESFDTGESELFSLADDRSEQRNLADEKPEVVRDLKARLIAWRESVGVRIPSPPLLTSPREMQFADHFSTGQVSQRWFFNSDWRTDSGELQRERTGSENTRIFLKDAEYGDSLIRFDFQLKESRDLRFMSGSNGPYNAVVHIRPDHFYIQTALDESGPYFPMRHGECAYRFEPDRWYSMTIEFLGDQIAAHIDRDHVAFARHPVLKKTRTYFAFQVDDAPAAFDNVQLFAVARHREFDAGLRHIQSVSGQHPVAKSLDDEFSIEKTNAHARLYQTQAAYRALCHRIDELDERNKQLYPLVFRSHKEIHHEVGDLRKKLLAEDARYKELLFATYRADRAIDEFLLQQHPEVAELPDNRRKSQLEKVRARFVNDSRYVELVALRDEAQRVLQSAYPQLFVSDEQINATREKRRDELKDDPDFQRANDERAAAWRAQQAYLFEQDARLSEVQRRIDAARK